MSKNLRRNWDLFFLLCYNPSYPLDSETAFVYAQISKLHYFFLNGHLEWVLPSFWTCLNLDKSPSNPISSSSSSSPLPLLLLLLPLLLLLFLLTLRLPGSLSDSEFLTLLIHANSKWTGCSRCAVGRMNSASSGCLQSLDSIVVFSGELCLIVG